MKENIQLGVIQFYKNLDYSFEVRQQGTEKLYFDYIFIHINPNFFPQSKACTE